METVIRAYWNLECFNLCLPMMAVGSQSMFVYDSGSSLLDLIKTKSLGAVAQHVGHFVLLGI